MKRTIEINPSSLYWAQFNRFELRLPGAAVLDIAQSGANDEAVETWVERCEFCTDNKGNPRATAGAIREELAEYGTWDEAELADEEQNRHRIVWLAAHNIAEEDEPCEEPSVSEVRA
jgi:hypothetical protein